MMTMTAQRLASALMLLCLVCAPALAAEGEAADEKKPTPNIGGTDQPGGVIKGVVNYVGATPDPKVIPVGADPFCIKARANSPLLNETYLFGKSGDQNTLVNVLVYVSKGLEGKQFDPPKEPAELDQVNCQYAPHVLGVVVGQKVDIKNSDPTLHNVMTPAPQNNPAFNKGMPVQGMVLNEAFKKPEMGMMVACAVHPWMRAYIHVIPHPYFAVTVEDGTFELRGLPDGEYEVSTWHEFKRFAPDKPAYKVTIKDGKADAPVKIVYGVAPPPAAN